MRFFITAGLLLVLICGCDRPNDRPSGQSRYNDHVSTDSQNDVIARAFHNQKSNIPVESSGTVIKILPDDLKGSVHQRFILRLANGQTLLIAHNIDLAPRLNELKPGEEIKFRGEYEWNAKGGAVHWTHHDPDGRHPGGWLEYKGKRYE